MWLSIGNSGRAMSILNVNSKKRKRPQVASKDKRTIEVGLHDVGSVSVDYWRSPGAESPKQTKRRHTNQTNMFSSGVFTTP